MFSASDVTAFLLTCKLAGINTVLLLLLGTPLAWWLSQTHLQTVRLGRHRSSITGLFDYASDG